MSFFSLDFLVLSNVFKCVNTGVCICVSDCCSSFSFGVICFCFLYFGVSQPWWCCSSSLVFIVFLLLILYMYTWKKRHTYTVIIQFIPLGGLSFFLSICLLYSFLFFLSMYVCSTTLSPSEQNNFITKIKNLFSCFSSIRCSSIEFKMFTERISIYV